MAANSKIFADKETNNWFKACIALNVTKEGLTNFVVNIMKKVHAALGSSCGQCSIEKLMPCPTQGLCNKRKGNSCPFHKSYLPQQCHICEQVKLDIISHHRFKCPSWKNTNAQGWKSNWWDIAKCYLPPQGYADVSSVQESDFNAVINIILNCTPFLTYLSPSWLSPPPPDPQCPLEKVRQIGRDVRHSANCKATDAELHDYFQILTMLLADPVCLAHDTTANKALSRITDLQNDRLPLTDFGNLIQECKQAIERVKDAAEKEFSEKAKQTLGEGLYKIKEALKDGEQEIRNKLQQADNEITEKINKATSQIEQMKHESVQTLYDRTEYCKQQLGDQTSKAVHTIQTKTCVSITQIDTLTKSSVQLIEDHTREGMQRMQQKIADKAGEDDYERDVEEYESKPLMMSSTTTNSEAGHSESFPETESENSVVFAIKLDPLLKTKVHNKNAPIERRRSAINVLLTIANLQTNRDCGELGVYCRHRTIYLITKAKLSWKDHWFKDVNRLPATFMGYLGTTGELKICGKSRENSQDIQSAFASLDSLLTPDNVFYINYNDLKKTISVSDCKGKAFLEYPDKMHFDCFKTHAGSKLNVFPTNPPVHNVPAQESEDSEQESHSVQAENDADALSSIAPSSSIRDFPNVHSNYSSSNHSHLTFSSHSHNNLSVGNNNSDGNQRFDSGEFNRQPVGNAADVSNDALVLNCQNQHDDVSPHNDYSRHENRILQNPEAIYPTAKYPNFRHEEDRRQSFSTWPRTLPSAHDFVSRGFFYTGNGDLVRCFCCGIGLKDFSDTDNPLMEHVKHSRNCPFLLDYFGSREEIQRYAQGIVTQEPEEIRRQQRQRYNSIQGRNVNGYRARHERLRSLQARLDTFTNWPSHLAQTPYQLAEAGLYYTGVDDHCRCFACDGGLRKWEPGDDPWIEHCRWFPACPHAIETKGRDFIDLIQLSADQAADENASAPQEEITSSVARMSMEDSLVQRITDRYDSMLNGSMGFSKEEIKNAVLELVQQGNKAPNEEDIVTQIEIITERNTILHEVRTSQNVEQTGDGLLVENTRLKGILMCCICRKNQVNILFLPCTHHKVCLDCSRDIQSCPLCKRAIKDKIRTYML